MDASEAEDEQDFGTVHRAHEKAIYDFILSQVNDVDVAADLTVEVFVGAYRSWERFRINRPMPVADWLFSIARYCCKTARKRKKWADRWNPASEDDGTST